MPPTGRRVTLRMSNTVGGQPESFAWDGALAGGGFLVTTGSG
jgi:hypothetical protein